MSNKENVQQQQPPQLKHHDNHQNNQFEAHKELTQKSFDVNQMKHQLEAWKFILVSVNNLVEWERQYDPLIIVTVDTLLFGFIYFYNPSILTTVAMMGLFFLTLEYAVPLLTSYFFKNSDWDTTSDAKYTRICERITNLYHHVISFKEKIEKIRKEKQPLYFLMVFFFLIFCAYIGQSIDNILLTYLAVLVITLTPGIRRHQLVQKALYHIKKTLGLAKNEQPPMSSSFANKFK